MIRLQAADASVVIDPDDGGRLTSLTVLDTDILVRPSGAIGAIPTSGSFVMAPWVGEMSGGTLTFRGSTYRFPVNERGNAGHGLVAWGPWDVLESTERSALLSRPLADPWPFGGVVRQRIVLGPSDLQQVVEIQAGSQSMPVSAGWHPWFRRAESGVHRIRVDASKQLELDDARVPTGLIEAVQHDTDLRDEPVLGERRIDVVYVEVKGRVDLATAATRLSIEFDPLISTVVVYTPPEAICVEPWSSWPDAVRMKAGGHDTGVTVLGPRELFRRWTRWSWARLSSPTA